MIKTPWNKNKSDGVYYEEVLFPFDMPLMPPGYNGYKGFKFRIINDKIELQHLKAGEYVKYNGKYGVYDGSEFLEQEDLDEIVRSIKEIRNNDKTTVE